ncbi:MAG TPA: helix-turn-helix domain-containing protein [Vicinamibacterales bacterium]|nr:helix-turn-helix domain-containing protein [Vicinamibacterales bacterium]
MTQTERIYRLLVERPEGITAIDALNEAGSFRLAARISDLREGGYHISSTMEPTPNGKRIARYRLVEPTLWGRVEA